MGYSVVFHRRCWISWGSCGCETKWLGSFTPFHCIADERVRQNLFVFSHISREYLKYTLAISEHSSSFLMLPSQVIQVSTIIVTRYTTTLRYLQTEGLLDKLITLWEYCKIIWQLGSARMQYPGGFHVPENASKTEFNQESSLRCLIRHIQIHISPVSGQPPLPSAEVQSFVLTVDACCVDASYICWCWADCSISFTFLQLLHKQKLPPCNFFYLARCKDWCQNTQFWHHSHPPHSGPNLYVSLLFPVVTL